MPAFPQKEKHPDTDIAAIFNTQYSKSTILDSVLSRQKYFADGASEKIKTGLKNLEQRPRDVGAETSQATQNLCQFKQTNEECLTKRS